jgi:predicted membrane protein
MNINFLIGVTLLFGLIFEIFYFFIYPLFRMCYCKVGDVYYKNLKDKNPFEKNKEIRKEYRVLDIKNGYVKYEDIDVYYDEENKIEFERGWVHSSRIYSFLCLDEIKSTGQCIKLL